MISILGRLFRCTKAAVAVEAAIFTPFFLLLTIGITDLGSAMFVGMQVDAAAQSGASYAVINFGSAANPGVCYSGPSGACLSGITTAMDDAIGNSSFCTVSVCAASFTSCADPNGGICFAVSANYPFTPFLSDAVYSWATAMTYSSTVTVRIQ
jgi:Flp pilus assembly protein TadG